MKNVIVASFKEESKAIDGLHKLNQLESFGDISVYDKLMVRKKENGNVEVLKQDDSLGWRTLTGMGIGSVLGLLGGPIGFVIGLYTGTAVGIFADASYFDFTDEFVAKVGKKIAVGTVAIIAEIEEDSEAFIDSYLKPLGAEISRSDIYLEFDKYVDEEIEEIEAEIAEERAALKKALGNEKNKIQKKIAALQQKRREKISEFIAKSKQTAQDIKGKAASSVEKVKSGIKATGTAISREIKTERIERIQRRIDRHQEIIGHLKTQLIQLQD
jgi:uncharacterized membrane protein